MREWTGQTESLFAVMSRQASRDFDGYAIEKLGVPGVVLMENAGRGAAEVILGLFLPKPIHRAAVFCGAGNNGGDGFVIARHLVNHGCDVRIILCADPNRIRGDAQINYTICLRLGIPMTPLDIESPKLPKAVRTLTSDCDVVVDALFGTGLNGELAAPFVGLISCLNAQPRPIVAVDIPSGLDCDTGWPLPVCIQAAATITFAGLKQGFVSNPDAGRVTGRVFVASIGVEPDLSR